MSTTEKPVYRRPAEVLEHLIGCPAKPERIEAFQGRRPRTVTGDAGPAITHETTTTTRCIDCGAQIVKVS